MQYELALRFRTDGAEQRVERFQRAGREAGTEFDRAQKRIDRAARSARRYGTDTEKAAGASDRGARAARGYGQATDRAAGSSDRAAKSADRMGSSLGRTVRTLALVTGGVLTLHGALGQIRGSIDVFEAFESRMAGVQAVSRAAPKDFARLLEQVRDLGATTVFSARQAAEAQENLARAGFTVNENLAALPATLDLAASSELGLATAADITAGTLRGFQQDASRTSEVVDVLATTAAISNTRVEDMGEALKFAAPTAQGLGISLKDTAAVMAVLADNMLRGTLGGTGFRQAMLGIIDPSGDAETVLSDLNISAEAFRQTVAEKGLIAGLDLLISKSSGLTEAIDLAGARGGTALQIILSQIDRLVDKRQQLEDVTGAAREMSEIRMDTVAGDMRELESVIESLRIDFGDALAPALREALDVLTEFFSQSRAGAQEFGREMGTLIVGTVQILTFLAGGADVAKAALGAFVAIKLAQFLAAGLAGIGKLAAAMYAYAPGAAAATTATSTLAASQTAAATTATTLDGAMVRSNIIFGARGEILSVVTAQTNALAGAQLGQAGAAGKASAANRTMLGGLSRLAVGLGVVAAAALLIGDRFSDWAASSARDIQSIIDKSEKLRERVDSLRQDADALLAPGRAEAELERQLLARGIGADDPKAAEVRAQVEASLQRERVDLLFEQEERLEALRDLEEQRREEIEQTIRRLPELKRELDAALEAEGGGRANISRGGFLDEDFLEAGAGFEQARAALENAEAALLNLRGESSDAQVEINALTEKTGQLRTEAEKYVPAAEAVAEGTGKLSKEAREAAEKYEKLKADLEASALSLNTLADAYERNDGSARAALEKVDLESRLRRVSIKLTEDQRKELERLALLEIAAEKRAAGAETISKLDQELQASRALTAAKRQGAAASIDAEKRLDAEARARDLTARATDGQREEIEDLVAALADEKAEQAALDAARGIRDETSALEGLAKAYGTSLTAGKRAAAQLRVEAAIRESAADHTGEHAAAIEREAAARERARALGGARESVALLEDEALQLETLAGIRRQDFASEEAFAGALRRVNTEREVRVALLALEAQRAAALAAVRRQDFASEEAFRDALAGVNDEFSRLAERTAAAIRGQAESREQIDRNRDAVGFFEGAWQDLGRTVSQVVGSINSDLGSLVGSIFSAVDAFRALKAAQAQGGGGLFSAESRQAGAGVAGILGAASGAFGLGGGGTSQFGGALTRNYGAELAQLGAALGPVGAAVGFALGSFIEESADVATIILRSAETAGGVATAAITRADGGLAEVASQIAATLDAFLAQVRNVIDLDVDAGLADLSITVEGDIVTVRVRGLVQGFRDLGEALGWAAEQLLAAQTGVDGFGENVRRLLEGLGGPDAAGSVEDLGEALGLAQIADAMREGIAPSALTASLRELIAQREHELDLARRYNLVIRDVLAVGDARLAQARAELEASRASFLGVSDSVSRAIELAAALEAFGREMDAERERREALAAAQQQTASDLAAQGDATLEAGAVAVDATGKMLDLAGAMGEGGRGARDLGDEVSDLGNDARDGRIELEGQRREMGRVREEADALLDSLADIPTAFDPQDIVDIFTSAAAQSGQALIDMIRVVRGEQFALAEEQRFATAQYAIQLALQIQSVETLLAATQTLDAITRAYLEGLVEEGNRILTGLASGDITIRPPSVPRPSAPRPSAPSGPSDAEREAERAAEALADFAEELRLLRLEVGSTDDYVRFRLALEAIHDRVLEMRDLGAAEADLREFQLLSFERLRRGLIEAAQAGTAADTAADRVGSLFDRFQTLFANAAALATRQAEVLGTSVEEQFRPIKDELDALLREQLFTQLADDISSLADAGDIEGLQDLLSVFGDLSDLPPGVRAALEPLIPEIMEMIEQGMRDAGAALIDGLGLPLEQVRSRVSDLATSLMNLDAALAAGAISAEQHASTIAQLADATFLDLGGRALAFLDQYFEESTAGEEARRALQELTFTARLAQLELELELVRGLGLLTEAQLQSIEDALGFVRDNMPDFSRPIDGAGRPTPRPVPVAPADDRARLLESALEELDRWTTELDDANLDPLARQLAQLDRRGQDLIDRLIAAGASMADVARAEETLARAREQAIEDAFEAAREPLRDLLEELRGGGAAGGRAGFEADRARFRDLRERALAGDLEATQELPDAIRALLESSAAFQGEGVGAKKLREEIERALVDVTGLETRDAVDPVVDEVSRGNTILGEIRDLLGSDRATAAGTQASARSADPSVRDRTDGARTARDGAADRRPGRRRLRSERPELPPLVPVPLPVAAAAGAIVIEMPERESAAARAEREAAQRARRTEERQGRAALLQREHHRELLAELVEVVRRSGAAKSEPPIGGLK